MNAWNVLIQLGVAGGVLFVVGRLGAQLIAGLLKGDELRTRVFREVEDKRTEALERALRSIVEKVDEHNTMAIEAKHEILTGLGDIGDRVHRLEDRVDDLEHRRSGMGRK